jgi:hypothetical protein
MGVSVAAPDIGVDAERVAPQIQERIEKSLLSRFPAWSFEARPLSRSSVRLLGNREGERLSVLTQYMATADDARRRLESYRYSISVGIGSPVAKIGDQAFLMVYGSQVILRFRQNEVLVEIRALPETREGPWDDGHSALRKKVVLEAASDVAEQIHESPAPTVSGRVH